MLSYVNITLHDNYHQYLTVFTLTSTSAAIKGVNCVECKFLHCDCRASRGVDYQSMPMQCIGFISSQHAIGVVLVSKEVRFGIDFNDSSPMCIACKTIKLFKFFLVRSQCKQSIVISRAHINVLIAYCTCNTVASHYAFFLRT